MLRLLGHFEDAARASLGSEKLGVVVLDELPQGPLIEALDYFRLLPLRLLALLVGVEPFEDPLQQPHHFHLDRVLGPAHGVVVGVVGGVVVEKEDLLCPSSADERLVRWCGRRAGWLRVFLGWLVSVPR